MTNMCKIEMFRRQEKKEGRKLAEGVKAIVRTQETTLFI